MILFGDDRFFPKMKDEDIPSYGHPFWWVGHPASREGKNEYSVLHREFITNRHKLEIIGGVDDPNACYDYDEFAIVRYKRKLYLLETSGCSCPSPSETWSIIHGPTTKAALIAAIKAGEYQGYTLPEWAEAELLKVIAEA